MSSDQQAKGHRLRDGVGEAAEIRGYQESSDPALLHGLVTKCGESLFAGLGPNRIDKIAPNQEEQRNPDRNPTEHGKNYPVSHFNNSVAGDVKFGAEAGGLLELSGQESVQGIAVNHEGGQPERRPAQLIARQPEQTDRCQA